ncbi:MAG TPA: SMC-Scp complex subunit ScpB [Candidatus Bathyarchaeia archaeon]|nr:SMC-Scp complex subunit ScpB [Candidatus Bathyarchaeia archaeon]
MSESSSQTIQSDERTLDKATMIEAALYVTGRPMDLKTLGTITNLRSEDKIRELARQLKDKYSKEGGALEVLELSDGRFVMQLKPRFAPHVKRLATRQLLTPGPMKTLSFIAYKQPVTQSYLARVRGNLAYSHVKQLQEVGLVSEEKLGRTKVLRTTQNFADYFNLSQDMQTMKRQLERIFEGIKASKIKELNTPETTQSPPAS